MSEAQYHDATERRARKLLQEHTPVELAVIAAQHMIFIDEVKHSSAKKRTVSEEPRLGMIRPKHSMIQMTEAEFRRTLETLALRLKVDFVQETTKIVTLATKQRMKHSSKTANDARHEANRKRLAKAVEEWVAWEERSPNGNKVIDRFAKQYCTKYAVTKDVLRKWISDYEKKKPVP